jgi:hypothetical protein
MAGAVETGHQPRETAAEAKQRHLEKAKKKKLMAATSALALNKVFVG